MNKDSKKNQQGQSFVCYFQELRHKYENISHLDILIYGEICYKNKLNTGCFASNEFFANKFRESILTVKRSISRLVELGLITRVISHGSSRKLFVVDNSIKEGITDDMVGITNDMVGITDDMGGITNDMVGITDDMIEENNKENIKKNNKDNIKYNNNNNKNLDLVEGMWGVDNTTSTNTPTGEDIIPGNDDGVDLSDYLKIDEIPPIEEKKVEEYNDLSNNSIKEIIQGDIEDVFSYEEKKNALNYSSTNEEYKMEFDYLNNLSEEELEAELKKLEN